MKGIRVKINIYKSEDILGKKGVNGMKDDEWCYAFVQEGEGVYLAEVWGEGKYCYASEDIVLEDLFNQIKETDKTMYTKDTWVEYRSDIVKDLLFPEEYEREIDE
jgi:hypothetical protein